MDAREARNDFQAGRLSAEQVLALLERQERLVQHLHAEVQRLKQRLAQYEPEILREPTPRQADPPPPSASYSVDAEEQRRRPRRRRKQSPGRRPTERKFAEAQRIEAIYPEGVPRAAFLPMEDVKLPLTAHLEELRSRLIRSLIALGVAFVVCYQFVEPLMGWLIAPVKQFDAKKVQIIGTGLAEAFFTKLKVAFFAGIFLASPVILYQIQNKYRDEAATAAPPIRTASCRTWRRWSECATRPMPRAASCTPTRRGT